MKFEPLVKTEDIKRFELESKLRDMFSYGITDIVLFAKKYQRLPKWMKDICLRTGVKIKRSSYVENGKVYLLDNQMNRYWKTVKPLKVNL